MREREGDEMMEGRRTNRIPIGVGVGIGVREIEQPAPRMMLWSDPWAAVMAFGRMSTLVAGAEALLVVDRGWGMDIWTVVNRSSAQTRRQLADKQWDFMRVFPDLDVDFHILDRRDESLEGFVRPSDYDIFIRLKVNDYS